MRVTLLLVIASLGGSLAPVDATGQTSILRPGLSLGQRPNLLPGAPWLGLYKTPAGYVLQPATIAIADTTDPCAGDAILIRVLGKAPPEFLLLAPDLKPGPVRTASADAIFLHPGQGASLQTNPGEYYWLVAYGKAEPVTGNTLFTECRLLVARGQHADTLAFPARFVDDGHPVILWAGDLDRDGRPDFIADLTTHYEGHRWALFLSTPPGAPRRLLPLAERIEPGC